MVSLNALAEFAVQTIIIFAAFFVIGTFVRGQMLAGGVTKILMFFALVALAGALTGAHYATKRVATMHNQPAIHQ